MSTISPLETFYRGHRFRSRTEARWAVFLDALGLRFEYEREGYDLDGAWYLPDFWVPEIGHWLEIKGEEPTRIERNKCRALSAHTGKPVLLAVGAPMPEYAIHRWSDGASDDPLRYMFAVDRRCEKEFWLYYEYPNKSSGAFSLNPQPGNDHDRAPLSNSGLIERAYHRSRGMRFDGHDNSHGAA